MILDQGSVRATFRLPEYQLVVYHPELRADTLVGVLDPGARYAWPVVIPLSEISRLDRRERASSTGMASGALLGAIGGSIAGVAVVEGGGFSFDDETPTTGESIRAGLGGALLGAILGCAIGAVVGLAFTQWTPIEIPHESGPQAGPAGPESDWSVDPGSRDLRGGWMISLDGSVSR
jgi:hypothetical protein